MPINVRILASNEASVLAKIAPGVFDDPIDADGAARFFADPRHVLVVALDGDLVVGMISAVEYFHPDKAAPELWLNEVGVADAYQRQGIAKQMLAAAFAEGRRRGCTEAWVATDRDNTAAMALYAGGLGASPPTDHVMFTFDLG